MPFTGSHPAAVLPLMRLGLVPSALVIGSMSADLPYYLPIPIDSASTHSAVGILGVDLLLGWSSFVIWQLLVAPMALALAPSALRARLRWHPDAGRPLLLVLSLWIGATTHVVWDEFTHIGRFGYRHVAWLAERHGPLDGYRWAQYGSGVVGALLIALAVVRWWRSAPVVVAPESQLSPRARVVIPVLVALATVGAAVTGFTWALAQDEGLRRALFLTATWGGGAGLVVVLAAAGWFRSSVSDEAAG